MKTIKNFLLGRDLKLANYPSAIVLFFRFFTGMMMLPYGWGKIKDYDNLSQDFFQDPIGIGNLPSLWLTIFAQLVCPFFLMVGFQTRSAAFIMFFNMLVATKYHFFDPFSKTALPMLFMGMYFVQTLMGGGKYSVDNLLDPKRQVIYPYQWAGVVTLVGSFILAWFVFANTFSGLLSSILLLVIALLWVLAFRLLK